jgi:hypothetical protein
MKKTIRDARTRQRMRIAELRRNDLTAVIGGHNGTIIVENAAPDLPQPQPR